MTKEKLKQTRADLGLTQPEMAKALKTPVGTYKKWEYGDRRVPGLVWVALDCLRKKGLGRK